MNIANIMTVISFTIVTIIVITLIIIGTYIFYIDRKQMQHPILRNYPLLGRARYFLEQIGPELRQYFFYHDLEGKPFSRKDYEHIVKSAKYKRDVIGFGSQRDFETLRDKRVMTLDMGTVVAGTKYRGEFEDRLKKVMEE